MKSSSKEAEELAAWHLRRNGIHESIEPYYSDYKNVFVAGYMAQRVALIDLAVVLRVFLQKLNDTNAIVPVEVVEVETRLSAIE